MKGSTTVLYRGKRSGELTSASLVVSLLLSGCSKSKNSNRSESSSRAEGGATDNRKIQTAAAPMREPALSQGSGYAHVTFQPNVHMMEREEGQKALIGMSSNEAGLLFDASNATARNLKEGDVLVIKGLIARSVLAAEATPDGVMVLTQQASFADVIQDGENRRHATAFRGHRPQERRTAPTAS